MLAEEECYMVYIKLIHCQNFLWFMCYNGNPRLKVKGAHCQRRASFCRGSAHAWLPVCSWAALGKSSLLHSLEVLLYRPEPEKEELLSWMLRSWEEEFSEWWSLLHTQQPGPKLSLAPSHWWLMQAGRAVLESPLVPAPPPQHWKVSAERISPSPSAVTAVLLTPQWDPSLDPGQCASHWQWNHEQLLTCPCCDSFSHWPDSALCRGARSSHAGPAPAAPAARSSTRERTGSPVGGCGGWIQWEPANLWPLGQEHSMTCYLLQLQTICSAQPRPFLLQWQGGLGVI